MAGASSSNRAAGVSDQEAVRREWRLGHGSKCSQGHSAHHVHTLPPHHPWRPQVSTSAPHACVTTAPCLCMTVRRYTVWSTSARLWTWIEHCSSTARCRSAACSCRFVVPACSMDPREAEATVDAIMQPYFFDHKETARRLIDTHHASFRQ